MTVKSLHKFSIGVVIVFIDAQKPLILLSIEQILKNESTMTVIIIN